jgi:hypothetical protein
MNAPPLLVNFDSGAAETDVALLLSALGAETRARDGEHIRALVGLGLPPAVSVRAVATLFGYSNGFVHSLAHANSPFYRHFTIRTGRKNRAIVAPKVALKVVQKWLGFHLARGMRFDASVCGFVPGRSTLTAASVHCPARWVYSVDIRDFFASTPVDRVVSGLAAQNFPADAAKLVANLSSFRGHLAQGSPASPVLSNVAFGEADGALLRIAHECDAEYSRYADDIVFSGKGPVPQGICDRVRDVIEGFGWAVAPGKERLAELPHRLKVFGLLVHGDRPRLTKGYRNRIRAYKHLLERDKIATKDLARIRGHLAYAESVERVAPF